MFNSFFMVSEGFLLRLAIIMPKCFLPEVRYLSCRMRKCFLLWVKKVRWSRIALLSCSSSLELCIPASTACKTSNPLFFRLAAIFTETSSSRYREMKSFSGDKLWIFLFYNIFSNVLFDFIPVIGIVTQGIENLRKGKMGKVFQNLFRRCPKLPPFYNGTYRGSCAFNNRLSFKDFIIANNIRMFCSYYHLDNFILPC